MIITLLVIWGLIGLIFGYMSFHLEQDLYAKDIWWIFVLPIVGPVALWIWVGMMLKRHNCQFRPILRKALTPQQKKHNQHTKRASHRLRDAIRMMVPREYAGIVPDYTNPDDVGAFIHGETAKKRGSDISSAPYRKETARYAAWILGYKTEIYAPEEVK